MPVTAIYSDKEKTGWTYDHKRKQWRGYLLDAYKFDRIGKPFKRVRVQYARKIDAAHAELEIENENKNARLGIVKIKQSEQPTLRDLLDKHQSSYTRKHRVNLAKRVYALFLSLLPDDIKVIELKTADFQKYVELRLKSVQPKTVNHELGVITPALKSGYLYFSQLDGWQLPKIPRQPNANRRRERLVTDAEKSKLLNHLTRTRDANELEKNYFHRIRLAHWVEFSGLTGFRRADIAAIKKSSFDAPDSSLINVFRHKQNKFTPYFPLSARAAEIIEERIKLQPDSEYIFSFDGLPVHGNYRTLKEVCAALGIKYGKRTDGGFIMHDLKHNFATDMSQYTDIQTLRELTSNSSDSINVYLHTNKKRMREAVRKMEKLDITANLEELFEQVINKKIDKKTFVEAVKNLLF